MKKDIHFPRVEGVSVAISREKNAADEYEYAVYVINENEEDLDNVIVNSSGYSEDKKTSTLRHYIEHMGPHSAVRVEGIQPELFELVNQFWVSYYIDEKVFDKKFLFVPESIRDDNFSYIESIRREGILHA